MPRVLNVGGGASRSLPPTYDGWEQLLLDIDPDVGADIVCDAKDLLSLEANSFDAVYCSHNLEHFYQHDVPAVLGGFLHVLKDTGFADIAVPNITNLLQEMVSRGHDINDIWYRTGGGLPITFHDVLFGWSQAMKGGNIYYSHKCGFTALSLGTALQAAGFQDVQVIDKGMNLQGLGYKKGKA